MDTLPLPDGVNHVVTFAEYARVGGELDAARAERDRLAAENAELKRRDDIVSRERAEAEIALHAAHSTLDALREAIRRQHAELFYVTAAQHLRVGFDAKKETTNGN